MNAPASAVPSREAVDRQVSLLTDSAALTSLPVWVRMEYEKSADMLRTLLAEVERLTLPDGSIVIQQGTLDHIRTTVAQLERTVAEGKALLLDCTESLKRANATVADQAAALAERDKVVAEMRKFAPASYSLAYATAATVIAWADQLAASVSTQEKPK